MTRHQKGLGGAPDMLATYIKNFGTDGIVQARDFVEQWEKALPGEGATAIRAILSQLSDPTQQRAFLGGDLPRGTPFGVLKPDAIPNYNHIMAPEGAARDSMGDEATPVPLTNNMNDEKPRWVYDPETGNAGWVVPKKIQLMSSDEPTAQAQADKTGRDVDEIDHGLLARFLDRREPQVGAGVQVAQNSGTMSDAMPESGSNQQLAQASTKAAAPKTEIFKGEDTTDTYRNMIVARETVGIAKPLEASKGLGTDNEVLGQYQLNREALVDAGFKNADGTWKEGNSLGIKSNDEFLRGPNAKAAQDKAFEEVSRRNEQHIRNTGLDQKIGTKIDGIRAEIQVTETGLAAATHRGGVRNVKIYFETLDRFGGDSKKAADSLQDRAKDMYLAIETRLREFSNVTYRQPKPTH